MSLNDEGLNKPLATINIIPLIDVMLVLLVLFIITAPLLAPQVFGLQLPQVDHQTTPTQSTAIRLSLDAQDQLYWQQQRIDLKTLHKILQQPSNQQATFQLYVDKNVRYERITQVIAVVHQAGIEQIGLVTLPCHKDCL